MTQGHEPFSRRYGYQIPDPKIVIRQDAPQWLRGWLLRAAADYHLSPADLVEIARQLLPETQEQISRPMAEVMLVLGSCEWYEVYDFAEGIYAALREDQTQSAARYEGRLNKTLREEGIGWQMRSGKIEVRGSEPFESVIRQASDTLAEHGRTTAAGQIHEALRDLSRRPQPDISGAIQHAMAALECVMRDLSGESGATLGELLKRHCDPLGIQPPLDQALIKLWGYASERGRHLREGREPGFEEAELVVSVAAATSVYLSKQAAR